MISHIYGERYFRFDFEYLCAEFRKEKVVCYSISKKTGAVTFLGEVKKGEVIRAQNFYELSWSRSHAAERLFRMIVDNESPLLTSW